jgi:stromal interaction molecule 1
MRSQIIYIQFFLNIIGAASGSCSTDDLDCTTDSDYLGLEAIRSLHRQLDDDDNGDIDLSESDDV